MLAETNADLPRWYTERFAEDRDVMWIPVFGRTWTFERGRDPYVKEGIRELTRGQARAMAANEWGEDFVGVRVRKVWMQLAPPEDEYAWPDDMAWECPKGAEDAMPYWRCEFISWSERHAR